MIIDWRPEHLYSPELTKHVKSEEREALGTSESSRLRGLRLCLLRTEIWQID